MRIAVVIGTPLPDSLNHALAARYAQAARDAGAEVRVIDLAAQPIPPHPNALAQLQAREGSATEHLPEEVAESMRTIEWADHVALFYPQWWGTYPAAFKAFLDRLLVPGFGYKHTGQGLGWDKLLAGRTGRIVHTMDSPTLWSGILYGDSAIRTVRRATLWYVGIRTIGVTRLAKVRTSTPELRDRWIERMGRYGAADAQRTPKITHPQDRTPEQVRA